MSDTRRGAGPDRPNRGLDDDEFQAVVEDLTVTLEEVKRELERERERQTRDRRGLFGLPRPPSGQQLLRFAEEFAIPAAITVLEANVKLLKQLRRAIRIARTGRETRERTREVGEGAVDVGQDLLERVGDGLRDLRSAVEGGAIPEDAAGDDLLSEVDDLQDEIDDRVSDARERRAESERRREQRRDERRRSRREDGAADREGDGDGDADEDRTRRRSRRRDEEAQVDVDAELESLKERYRGDEEDQDDDGDTGVDADGGDADDDGPSAGGADADDGDSDE